MASFDYPRAPITFPQMREFVRTGLNGVEARRYWWPILVKVKYKQNVTNPPDVSASAVKRYTWAIQSLTGNDDPVDVNLEYSEDSDEVTAEVLQLLTRQYHVPEPGTLEPFVHHISRVICNKAICFSLCCDFMDRPGWYISPDAMSHRLKLHTFRELIKRFMVQTYTVLDGIGALTDSFLNLILVDMMTPFLMPEQVDKIMDGYLIDGVKTLYRYGLALLKMFKKEIKSNTYRSGADFWNAMKQYQSGGIDFEVLKGFALEDKGKSLLKKKIIPSRAAIGAIEEEGKKKHGDFLRDPLNLPFSLAGSSAVASGEEGVRSSDSKIMDPISSNTLNSFIPLSHRMEGFELMFSTYNDGWSFTTLYEMTEHLAPCIIVCKTADSGALFGMFMSVAVSPPSVDVRGDGDCFCFRLDGPNAAKYPWKPPEEKIGMSDISTTSQFAHCTNNYMAFGGSQEFCTNAIRIDSDLLSASAGPSDTYDNPCLVPEEKSNPFALGDIEVFCGRSLVNKFGKTKSVPRKDK